MNKRPLIKRFLIIALPIFAVMLVFDLVLKHVLDSSMQVGQSTDFLPGFIDIVIVHNEGSAWGMFAGMNVFFIILTFIFIGVLFWYTLSENVVHPLYHIALGFVLAGSIGNLVDRIAFGYVRDFLHFEFWPSFPVFNIADMCLTVGVIVFLAYIIIMLVKHFKNKNGAKDENNQSGSKR